MGMFLWPDRLLEECGSHRTQERPGCGEAWGSGRVGGLQGCLLPGLCLPGRRQAESCARPKRTAVLMVVVVRGSRLCMCVCVC